ncbi:MAG: hypothetical protein E7293_03415 [Lachnospiraceae bacterium]|nr:hypothetical protein [Lachnospiraceae bacterium]
MAQYNQGISIDGQFFDVPLLSVKRKADFLDKYAERTEDGDMKRELIGVYFNYQMAFGTINDDDTYAALWDKLTEPVEFHDFVIPTTNGQYTFRGYISSVSDEIYRITGKTAKYKGLRCKYISKKPARIPEK